MKTFIAFFLVFILNNAKAQLENYSALTIPDSLKKDADVVVREEYMKFTIDDINKSKLEHHGIYTILNEQGKKMLSFEEYSDKFMQLDDAEIIVYDAMGIKQKTYRKKDMQTQANMDGLVPEGKITYFKVNAPAYPITVEINYSVKYKGFFIYPGDFLQHPYQAVQHEVLEVEAPTDLSFRYQLINCNYQPVKSQNNNRDFYRWELKNLPAYKIEKHVGSPYNYLPVVMLAPNKFKMDEYEGDMSSWKNFGNWINNLYASTVNLSEDRKIFYRDLVKNASNDKEKAKILYNYLQNNMRYVSIQLGIGGWQPFKASFVDEKKYGDCKALSNYMRTILDAVGIKSNIVIIQGGMVPRKVIEDFPASYFNHVILCIPNSKDSIWLECTSTSTPFNELGPFTENRKGMMITENGGVLVNTPQSHFENNTQVFHTKIVFNEDSNAVVESKMVAIGEEREHFANYFHDEKDDEKRRIFIHQLQWKQPDFIDIHTSNGKENPYIVNTKMEYEKVFSFKAGNKYFLMPRLYPIFEEDVPEKEKRKLDYYFSYPYQTMDTTIYQLPANFTLESLPKDKNINYAFGTYTSNYHWDASTHLLTTITTLQIKERIVRAYDYQKLLDFKNQVLSDVNEKIVIRKE